MAVTALSFITLALQELGVYATNETVSSADSAFALTKLNNMLDSWSNERLTCYANLEQSFALAVNVSQYPLGPGSSYSTTRPIAIKTGNGSAYIQDAQGNNYWVNVQEQDTWNMIGNRTVNSNVPTDIFYDPKYPQGLLNVYPVPNSGGYTLFFDSRLQLSNLTTITSSISLPPGYATSIIYCLAIELMPAFGIDPEAGSNKAIVKLAAHHKANIKRTNSKFTAASYDPEIQARTGSSYNIYRDGR